MRVQKHNKKGKTFLEKYILVGFTILIGAAYFIFFTQLNKTIPPNNSLQKSYTSAIHSPTPQYNEREYTSKFNDFTITIPQGYKDKETHTSLYLTNEVGKITILSTGTYVDNLKESVLFLEEKNNLNMRNMREFMIGETPAIQAYIESPISKEPTSKAYFLYPSKWNRISFSTTSPDLYDDLEKVVYSFEYLGK